MIHSLLVWLRIKHEVPVSVAYEILHREADIHLPSAEGAMGLPRDYDKDA